MDRAFARLVAVIAVAAAGAACATVAGLHGYSQCNEHCDGGSLAEASPGGPREDGSAAMSDDDEAGDAVADDMSADGGSSLDGTSDSSMTMAPEADASDAGTPNATDGAAPDATDGAAPDASDSGPTCPAVTDLDGGRLLLYYPFEGSLADESGNGNNGVATVGTDITYTTGKLGQGISILTGGHGVKATGSTEVSGAKTLCAWVSPATAATGQAMPVFVGGAGGSVDYYDVEPAVSPSAGACTVTANTLFMDNGACSTSALALAPGAWNFVCYAYTGSSTTFFVNGGTHVASGAQYDPYTLAEITIGSDLIGGSTTQALFDGSMDEVSVWSGALSVSDMTGLYNGGAGCRLR
jgi:hypothetical protein